MGIRAYLALGIGLAVLATIAGLTISRNYWKGEATDLREQTYVVTARIGKAVGNTKLKWKDVAEQVERYADGHDQLVVETGIANQRIEELGTETERLRALNAELRAKASAEIKKRNKLIAKLDNDALTPGDREDCQAQIAAAEAALDAVFEEGL